MSQVRNSFDKGKKLNKLQKERERDAHVGIFWVGWKNEIIKYSKPIEVIVPVLEMKDLDLSHFDYWENIKKIAGYSELDYTDLPRGRIIYNEDKQQFIIYIKQSFINNKSITDKLIKEFNLTESQVKFSTDEHYG